MGTKKKQIPAIWILLGVLVLLLAVYFGMKIMNKKQVQKAAEQAEAETVYITDISEVNKIRYDIGNGEMAFEKQDDVWVYTADNDFPLLQTYPEGLADTFGKLKAERELKDGDALSEYGFDEPVYTVILTDSDGNDTELYFGHSVGDNYYVTVGDTGEVYTASSSVIGEITESLSEIAQYDDYPNIGSGNLKKEVITQNGTTTTYDSENEDDTENISAVAGGLGAVTLDTAADYSVEDEDLEIYGLDESSRIVVEATYTQNGEEGTLLLYIGCEDGEGNRYVMVNESRIVYLISDAVCGNILNEEDETETEE